MAFFILGFDVIQPKLFNMVTLNSVWLKIGHLYKLNSSNNMSKSLCVIIFIVLTSFALAQSHYSKNIINNDTGNNATNWFNVSLVDANQTNNAIQNFIPNNLKINDTIFVITNDTRIESSIPQNTNLNSTEEYNATSPNGPTYPEHILKLSTALQFINLTQLNNTYVFYSIIYYYY